MDLQGVALKVQEEMERDWARREDTRPSAGGGVVAEEVLWPWHFWEGPWDRSGCGRDGAGRVVFRGAACGRGSVEETGWGKPL